MGDREVSLVSDESQMFERFFQKPKMKQIYGLGIMCMEAYWLMGWMTTCASGLDMISSI